MTYTNHQLLKRVQSYSQYSFDGTQPCGHCFLFFYTLMKNGATR